MASPRETLESLGFRLPQYDPGRYYVTCPRCSSARKTHHQRLKCVGITIENDKFFGGCNHCGWTFPGPGDGIKGATTQAWPHYNYGSDLRKVRRPTGGFFWQHQNGKGVWESGTAGADTGAALYRIDEVREAIAAGEPVLVVEGEKDVDTCWRLGFATTCNAHGASEIDKAPKWTSAHSEQLRGADIVVLWDNDDAGIAHAHAVCKASVGVARSVRRIDLVDEWPDIPEGGDVSDWVAHGGGNSDALAQLVAESRHVDEPSTPEVKPTLPWVNVRAWDDHDPPEQQWTVADLIPVREVCLFSGHGAAGKSTVGLHLAAAHCAGLSWLNFMPTPGPAFFIDAEDDVGVINRRLAAIARSFGQTFTDLAEGGLHVLSLHGQDAVMASADKGGIVKPTPLYERILEAAGDIKPVQIIIASSANVYAGSEIDRAQVTQFTGLLARMAVVSGGSVILISHPSLTGMNNASGISGSTSWHNTVRARMYLEGVKNGEGADAQPDHDLRVLRFLKNQYGPPAAQLTLRYRDGMFLPETGGSTLDKAARESRADEVFLTLVRRFNATVRPVGDNVAAPNYAPKVFAKEPEATEHKITKTELEGAMRRLFKVNRVRIDEWGPPSKRRRFIVTS